jgi:hypothetical protein
MFLRKVKEKSTGYVNQILFWLFVFKKSSLEFLTIAL